MKNKRREKILSLTGATYLFVMTGIFFIASLLIKRPWCNYLCTITPVSDLLRLFRPGPKQGRVEIRLIGTDQ